MPRTALRVMLPCLLIAVAARPSAGASPPGTAVDNGGRSGRHGSLEPGLFEISPLVGFTGASPAMGVRAAMHYRGISLEMGAEHAGGRTATLYPLTANALVHLAHASRFLPYGLVGGGLFFIVPSNAVASETISAMGLNFGGGLRCALAPGLGLRFEVKQFFLRDYNPAYQSNVLHVFQETSLGVCFAINGR